jgi:hypothetical protein
MAAGASTGTTSNEAMADTNISRRMAFSSFRQVFFTGIGNTIDSFRRIWLHPTGLPDGRLLENHRVAVCLSILLSRSRFTASRQTFSHQADFLSPKTITGKWKYDPNQAVIAAGFVVRILH